MFSEHLFLRTSLESCFWKDHNISIWWLFKNFYDAVYSFILGLTLTPLRRKSLPYRNQSIGLQRTSVDWFLYDRNFRHERANSHRSLNIYFIDFHQLSGTVSSQPINQIILNCIYHNKEMIKNKPFELFRSAPIYSTILERIKSHTQKCVLILSWRRSLQCRNQYVDLLWKPMGWFLYDRAHDSRKDTIKYTAFFVN